MYTATVALRSLLLIVADDCAPNPCLNDAVCEDGLAMFTCVCSSGYKGTDCGEG